MTHPKPQTPHLAWLERDQQKGPANPLEGWRDLPPRVEPLDGQLTLVPAEELQTAKEREAARQAKLF